jgi:hypothetical protein
MAHKILMLIAPPSKTRDRICGQLDKGVFPSMIESRTRSRKEINAAPPTDVPVD